jgi:hypothetical protein
VGGKNFVERLAAGGGIFLGLGNNSRAGEVRVVWWSLGGWSCDGDKAKCMWDFKVLSIFFWPRCEMRCRRRVRPVWGVV